jgi:hypothetical protein
MNTLKRSFFFLILLFSTTASYALPVETAAELIDVVYTWVDGSDPRWHVIFSEYALKEGVSAAAVAKRRFKDHEELRYSLRSIHTYAPWVHHIYIVTFGQRPSWLAESPMITIVDHTELFKNPQHLPTFNSMAIECNLHHIRGLQEHYLYFNDDVFLGRNTTPNDYFTPTNKMKVFLSKRPLPTGAPIPGEEGFISASKNTGSLLNTLFSEEQRYMHSHTPYPTLKSFVKYVESRFSKIFDQVSSHRFRSLHDYTITNGLIPYVALNTGHGEQTFDSWVTNTFGVDPKHDHKDFKKLMVDRPKFFCLQDGADEDNPESLQLLNSFLEEYFPLPAPWEKKR